MRVCVRVFSVGFCPGLDSMSPARSRRSASHAAGTYGWLPQTNWAAGPPERRGRWIQFAQCSPGQSPDCGTVAHQPRAGCIRLVSSRLYPFGTAGHSDFHRHTTQHIFALIEHVYV